MKYFYQENIGSIEVTKLIKQRILDISNGMYYCSGRQPIIVTSAGSGSGKTRTCYEIMKIFMNKLRDIIYKKKVCENKNFYPILISFNNETSLKDEEINAIQDENRKAKELAILS